MSTVKETKMIDIDLLEADPHQPRTAEIDDPEESTIEELAESIKSQGVIEPIVVVEAPDGKYKIVSGHRRTRASKLAGMTTVPAVVMEEKNPGEMLAIQLIENIQRQKLSPYDLCLSVARLKNVYGMDNETIAKMLGKSRSWINRIALVAEDKGYAMTALKEGLFVNIEAAYRFRNLSAEDQEKLYSSAKSRGVKLTFSSVVDQKKKEFFIDSGGYSGSTGVYDPNKYSEPKTAFVSVDNATEAKRREYAEDIEDSDGVGTTTHQPGSAFNVTVDPQEFAIKVEDTPVVYKDIGDTWVIKVNERMLATFLEKQGTPAKTEKDLLAGVVSLFRSE